MDKAALLLLGWPSDERAAPTDAGEAASVGGSARWTALHSNARTTPEGATAFRRAVQLLAENKLTFHSGNAENGSGGGKDPLVVIKGYFRLVKCALEPAPGDAAGPLSEDEWVRLANDLLKKMGEAMAGAIQDRLALVSSEKADASSSSTPASVGCVSNGRPTRNAEAVLYYFRSILKHVHPHIRNRIRLLGPVYRCFCDVADSFVSLLEAERAKMDAFVATFLPSVGWEALSGLKNDADQLSKAWRECNVLFEQAAFHLLGLVDEALEKVQGALGERDQSLPSPEKQAKILIFLFARVTSLVQMSMRFPSSFGGEEVGTSGKSTPSGSEGGGKLMAGLIGRLVRVCSLSQMAHARLGDAAANRGHAALLDMVVELRPKAEQYLAKVMGDFDPRSARSISMGLRCFAELPLSGSDAQGEGSLAKLHLMKYVMERLLANDPLVFLEATTLLRFYESMLFVDIPRCHHSFGAAISGGNLPIQATSILSDLVCALEHASHMLCHSENKTGPGCENWQEVMTRQHQMLVRWLAPTSANLNASISQSTIHPMTNQLLLRVIERRIVSTCAVDEPYSKQDATHFVSLLSQLVLHPQTESSHRRNIATLLVRLLSSSSDMATSTNVNATSLTARMLWSNVSRAGIIKPATHKRKRSRGATRRSMLACDDILTICWVLEALAKCSVQSQTSIGSEVSTEMRQLWGNILDNSLCKTNEATFLLSLSIGALRGSSTIASFFQSFDYTPRNGASSSAFIDGVLAFLEPQLGTKSKSSSLSSRRVMMQSIAVRLVSALSECARGDLSESQVNVMGTLLENASAVTADPSEHATRLQYDIVATASRMGSAVRPEFGEESLQPLVSSMTQNMATSGWYCIAPRISSLEHFVGALPSNLRGLECIIQAMPAKSKLRLLFTSRKKGKIFSIVEEKEIDPADADSSFATEEARWLLARCSCETHRSVVSVDGSNSMMLIKSGSKVLVHRDDDGKVLAMTVLPDGHAKPSSEILSAIGSSKHDCHSVSSNCEVMLDR